MPKTLPTTVSPSPSDVRVIHLEQLLKVSRPHAVGVVVMSWSMMLAEESEGVVPLPVTILDKLVDIEGAGQALVDAGLVGVEPGGLVLPIGVRQASDRAKHRGESTEDRRKRQGRERKAKYRKRQRLTSPAKASGSKTSPPTIEAPKASRIHRCLGRVEGRPIMLLYRKADGVPFYKLEGASPKDFTGTVTDPDNPTLADALVALMSAMRREQQRGFQDASAFRPTMEQMVAAAYREKSRRESAEADAARRAEANGALAEAAADDQDNVYNGGPERDMSRSCPAVTRDSGTCPADVPLEVAEAVNGSPCSGKDLDADAEGSKCPAPCPIVAPSSSSSSSSLNELRKENTTTTSSSTTGQRDRDDILEGFVRDDILDSYVAPPPSPERVRQLERFKQFAEALGTTVDAVDSQARKEPATLAARLKAAGIDLRTGRPADAEASSKPVEARDDIDTTSDTTAGNKPAAGSVEARHEDPDRPTHDWLDTFVALRRQGIPVPEMKDAPGKGRRLDDDAFDEDHGELVTPVARA